MKRVGVRKISGGATFFIYMDEIFLGRFGVVVEVYCIFFEGDGFNNMK